MSNQWEFQDPKVEVLYHIRPYFGGIFPYIGLIYGRYLQFRSLKWPLNSIGITMVLLMPQVGAADDEGKLLAFLGPWCHGTHIFGAKNQLFWCEKKDTCKETSWIFRFF